MLQAAEAGVRPAMLEVAKAFESGCGLGEPPVDNSTFPGKKRLVRACVSICVKSNVDDCIAVYVQWNVSYPNTSGLDPVHNSEYSITVFHPDILARGSKVEFWECEGGKVEF